MAERCPSGAMEEPPLDEEPMKKSDPDATCTTMANGCFDCNICLDFAAEPVVTLCGHLYCWPCIYKWLQEAGAAMPSQCPVCKAALSEDTLVPLYGRGHSAKKPQQGPGIPSRPTIHREAVEYQTPRAEDELDAAFEQPPLQALDQQPHLAPPSLMGSGVIHSMAGGVIGGMAVAVLPWVLGNQALASMFYTNPYHVAGNGGGSPRLRRQEMEVEKSLHQIWFFLFIFVLLCLLWF